MDLIQKKIKEECNKYLSQIDTIKQKKDKIKSHLEESNEVGSQVEALSIEELMEVEKQIEKLKDEVKSIEQGLSH